MMEATLYKKTYKQMNCKEHKRIYTTLIPEDCKDKKHIKRPEKDALIRPFVQGAIDFSNDMGIDVEIVQKDDSIIVYFTFEGVRVFTDLKRVIELSDKIAISQNGNKLMLELAFITSITIPESADILLQGPDPVPINREFT